MCKVGLLEWNAYFLCLFGQFALWFLLLGVCFDLSCLSCFFCLLFCLLFLHLMVLLNCSVRIILCLLVLCLLVLCVMVLNWFRLLIWCLTDFAFLFILPWLALLKFFPNCVFFFKVKPVLLCEQYYIHESFHLRYEMYNVSVLLFIFNLVQEDFHLFK